MIRYERLVVLCLLLLPISVCAQQQLQHEKKYFQTPDGKIFWNAELPFFISISSNKDGSNGLLLQNTESSKSNYDSLYFTGHGKHYLKRSTSNANRWREEAFGIQVDGKAPVASIVFEGAPKYVSGGVTYYGKGLTATITAKDQTDMSGVDKILQSIDAAAYTDYTNTLILNTEKPYDLKFYSVDKVGNVESPKNRRFTVDLTAPTVNYTLSGDRIEAQNILSPRSKIELTAQDPISKVKRTSYQFDQKSYNTYVNRVSTASLTDGDHTFYYKSIDNVENETNEASYSFYLDRTVPVITAEVEGDLYQNNGISYISSRSRIQLSATDNKAGVKQIDFLIDGTGLTTYSAPFPIDKNQGKHRVSYYGIDNVENKGSAKTDATMNNLYLDLTSPKINLFFSGQQFKTRDTVFINGETKVNITSKDGQSGVQLINYKMDGQGEVSYGSPFTVNQAGAHQIVYSSKDQVNNASEASHYFVVDNQGPEIVRVFSTKPLGKHTENGITMDKYPSHNSIFLAASDDVVGAKTIYYSLDGAVEKVYTTPIVTGKKGVRTLKIRVIDQVKNETTENLTFYIE
ncbi:MAG: OmpL47-type beta-barrel domain-containing protein [Flammeovirgaceae bacterium]